MISLAAQENQLDIVNEILSPVCWHNDLDDVKNIIDAIATGGYQNITEDYNYAGSTQPKELQAFEKYILSGESGKDIFYTKIFPKALKSDET
ncbi:MAG: hypothetical protein JKY08_07575 [Flavobacteriaceae bacterium]|nr:hypothetical protein [Flavobacteriaceae bacterium]